mgnify:FL=1
MRHRNFLQYCIQQLRAHRLSDNDYVGLFSEIFLLDSSSAEGCGETETEGKEEDGESSSPSFDITGNLPTKEKPESETQSSFITSICLQSFKLGKFFSVWLSKSSCGVICKTGIVSSDNG